MQSDFFDHPECRLTFWPLQPDDYFFFFQKVSAIQKNVSEWEKKFAEEKVRDLEKLKQQHQQQVEKILEEWVEQSFNYWAVRNM